MAQADDIAVAGTPDPLDFRRHRKLTGVAGVFADGTAFAAGTNIVTVIAIAGQQNVRLRYKTATAGGTLSFLYMRPPPANATSYSASIAPPSANVTVTAGTEGYVDIQPAGESLLQVTFAPGGTGTITFMDCMFA